MINLPNIFSDKALYLHSSVLNIRGNAEKCDKITVNLIKNNEVVGEWSGTSDENGDFTVTIETPAASYDTYEISVKTTNDEKVIKDILFGELWLACGQSNMEMPHTLQPEWEDVRERLQGKCIRGYYQKRLSGDDNYPFEPLSDSEGSWKDPADEGFINLSAVASKFSLEIYEFLAARGEKVPVGFLNTNRGGTNIETWVPAEAFEKNEKFAYRAPNTEDWNTKGNLNYQQSAAHYNHHIGPIIGVKARGMLWYQGESNVSLENTKHIYKDYMIVLRESYKEKFAASETFPMISVQLFPWNYWNFGGSASTKLGYMNKAFSDMAKKYPDEFPFVPICDLPFIWGKWGGNHPIHPIHKYKIGDRLALLALNRYYGRSVKGLQTLPPMLKSCVRHGNKLRLTFENVGSGLFVKGKQAVGLYVRSKEGVYTPAYYEIVAKNVMNVYHPYIDKPCHVAYAVSDMEPKTNIFAGEFPVAPFCTDFIDGVDTTAKISLKPWLNNELDSAFVGHTEGTMFDFFNRAIFNPTSGSGVCYDSDFALDGRCLRVYALDQSQKTFGTFIRASQYATLDLQNYSALKLLIFHHNELKVKLALHYKEKDGVSSVCRIEATKGENGRLGWLEHSFDLSGIPDGTIEKAEILFTRGDNRLSYVFIDKLILVPKK